MDTEALEAVKERRLGYASSLGFVQRLNLRNDSPSVSLIVSFQCISGNPVVHAPSVSVAPGECVQVLVSVMPLTNGIFQEEVAVRCQTRHHEIVQLSGWVGPIVEIPVMSRYMMKPTCVGGSSVAQLPIVNRSTKRVGGSLRIPRAAAATVKILRTKKHVAVGPAVHHGLSMGDVRGPLVLSELLCGSALDLSQKVELIGGRRAPISTGDALYSRGRSSAESESFEVEDDGEDRMEMFADASQSDSIGFTLEPLRRR